MISFLSSFIKKVLFLYPSLFVLSGACSFKRFVKAELNALYVSFSKFFDVSWKAILKISVSKYLYDLKTFLGRALKTTRFHDC